MNGIGFSDKKPYIFKWMLYYSREDVFVHGWATLAIGEGKETNFDLLWVAASLIGGSKLAIATFFVPRMNERGGKREGSSRMPICPNEKKAERDPKLKFGLLVPLVKLSYVSSHMCVLWEWHTMGREAVFIMNVCVLDYVYLHAQWLSTHSYCLCGPLSAIVVPLQTCHSK